VARLDVDGESVPVVGVLAGVQPGENLRVSGRWVDDRKYGRQFRVESFLGVQPSTLVGIEKYLGSGLVRGVGPGLARKLVQHFGIDTLRVIDEEMGRLREVPGLGRVRIAAIRDAWRQQRGVRDVMVFLQSHGVGAAFAARIHKKYGARAVAVVKGDPYRLARDVAGIGFRSADRIAMSLGLQRDAPRRLEAGVLFALDQAAEEGHCFVPCARLLETAAALLEVDEGAVPPALERLAAAQQVVVEGSGADAAVYATPLHAVETAVARRLQRLLAAPPRRRPLDAGAAIRGFEAASGLHLAAAQRRAVQRALEAKVLVVTGGPGTGKTTLVRGILHIQEQHGVRVQLCAPTGRAAKRLSEATGRPARTLHRLLEWSPREHLFQRDAESPLDADAVVVDEVSMLDLMLLHHLLKALPPEAQLLLVGDADQLPSVGAGAVLADLVASGAVETVRLDEIFRQEGRSAIVTNAHRIRDGEPPLLPPAGERADFVFVERHAPEALRATLRTLVVERLPAGLGVDPRADVQVLVPMHRGPLGATALNADLQAALNPGGVPIGTSGLRVGDKVMQVRNNYELEVYNGDLGRIEAWDEAERVAHVRFDERAVAYEIGDLPELVLAYACTVHKSQGSEYPVVVVVLHRQHHVMLQRNLLYTAVSRARRQVVLLGERRALETALRNDRVQRRHTLLAERLRKAAG
jgi:exodeoxyribonuclease V alpha subunit